MESKDQEKRTILLFSEYEKIINEQKKDYARFVADGHRKYKDFDEFLSLFPVSFLTYDEYCDIHGYENEYKEEDEDKEIKENEKNNVNLSI